MKKVFIVDGLRSPIGSFLGSLKSLGSAKLGASVIKALLEKSGVGGKIVDEVITGNVLSAGAGMGVARQAAIGAGIPVETPAYSLNILCGSGMKAILNAVSEIRSGDAEVIVAGGIESMSNAPFLAPARLRQGFKMGDLVLEDHMLKDGLIDSFNNYHMGITAENVAEKYGISREAQDEFALNSQHKAIKAVDAGEFKDEIIPLEITEGKNTFTFDTDEHPNRTTNAEKLAKLRPAFKSDGTVTAGNTSGINDGACFLVIASEDAVKEHGLNPRAEIITTGIGGVDPKIMGLGPVPAIGSALKKAGMNLSDMEYIELNEAFAAQSLGVIRELSSLHGESEKSIIGRCNVNGGAIALGHPLGASGARITVTLLNILRKRDAQYGLASLCIGGGMGTAIIIRNIR
ncbi:MAG: acetyl-CoA C-acetyltransferase [Treponema sp.]|jgi:acetyl-CoA C-acetyltransferase|nr:acetyl-CoA C-acetyltransferase [Treponema sp.]